MIRTSQRLQRDYKMHPYRVTCMSSVRDFLGQIASIFLSEEKLVWPSDCYKCTLNSHFGFKYMFSYDKQEQSEAKAFEFYSCYENLHLETVSKTNNITIY